MPLPPLLLERLKRRKIIQEVRAPPSNEFADKHSDKNSPAARGASQTGVVQSNQDELEEEIIAEDYSDEQNDDNGVTKEVDRSPFECTGKEKFNAEPANSSQASHDDYNQGHPELSIQLTESVLGCPNKYNIYHDCSQYCIDKHGECKELSPTLEQRKQLALVLKNYPMSNEWRVVYDPGVRAFYFWNTISNLVSWFPPSMNGLISFSADQIRKAMRDMELAPDEPNN